MDTRSERVEAAGAKGVYDLDTCGRLGRRDERARKALRYTPRSLVSAPAVHHSVSRWRRPAAGWGGHTDLLCGRTDVRENFGERQLVKGKRMLTRGVKIISAQIYAGVDSKVSIAIPIRMVSVS